MMWRSLAVAATVASCIQSVLSSPVVKRQDWSKIDWSKIDWNSIDWSKVLKGVNWDKVDYTPSAAAAPAPAPASPPAYGGGGSGGGDYKPIGITGPVLTTNFPDPSIIHVNGVWYAFATETVGSSIRVQLASSPDFTHWTLRSGYDALARLPTWANPTTYRNVWAPDVSTLDDGTFIMYFTALVAGSPTKHCIGVATSRSVTGPYQPQDTPLVCPSVGAGAIDASAFKDWTTAWNQPGGQRYVVWKTEVAGTPISIRPVASNGVTFTGAATTILTNNGAADHYNTEAPQIVKGGAGDYFLFFSTGDFNSTSYTISYATAKSPTGPYTRQAASITSQIAGVTGPGGMDVDASGTRLAFAALIDHKLPVPDRGMWVTGILARNGKVTVG